MTGYTASVDPSKCASSGNCVSVASDVFAQRPEDGVAYVRDDAPERYDEDALLDALELCPAQAIQVSLTSGSEDES